MAPAVQPEGRAGRAWHALQVWLENRWAEGILRAGVVAKTGRDKRWAQAIGVFHDVDFGEGFAGWWLWVFGRTMSAWASELPTLPLTMTVRIV